MTTHAGIAASHRMVAEDTSWMIDVALSYPHAPAGYEVLPLLLYCHTARIAYEGHRLLTSSRTPGFATPGDAVPSEVIERARHATKLLEDNKKTLAAFQAEIATYSALHRQSLTQGVPRWAHPMADDLGLFWFKSSVVGATIPLQLRLGVGRRPLDAQLGVALFSAAQEMGDFLRTIATEFGVRIPDSLPTAITWPPNLVDSNHDAHRYLEARYDREFSHEVKLLLLMIESDLATAACLLPCTSPGHRAAVFRASLISAFHALWSVKKIIDNQTSATGSKTSLVRSFLGTDAAIDLMSPDTRRVRNAAMHYGLSPDLETDPSRPMSGVVEALHPSHTFESLELLVHHVVTDGIAVLARWRERG